MQMNILLCLHFYEFYAVNLLFNSLKEKNVSIYILTAVYLKKTKTNLILIL